MSHADAELGRLEDLPADYVQALRQLNLVPLWPSLRGVLPPSKPILNTRATHWPYEVIRPLLMKAGELTPIEKAERRVLVLANPGHGLDKMQASAAMYLGMQLLLPGEWAPSHRHTPNAVRMVVEGEGAWTTVDGVGRVAVRRRPLARQQQLHAQVNRRAGLQDRKSTRLNSSHSRRSRMPSSA